MTNRNLLILAPEEPADEGEGRLSSLLPTTRPHLPLIDLMHSPPVLRCGVDCYTVHCLGKKKNTNNKCFFSFFPIGKLAVVNGSSP